MRFYALGILISLMGCAVAENVPKDISYQGKAIDPLCFSPIGDSNANQIDLSKCGINFEKYALDVLDDSMTKQGFIGYEWKETNQTYQAHGYSYYKYFDAGQGHYWIYSINNTGGSGSFSALLLVKRINNTTLEVKPYLGGDRCNGGIADVQSDLNGQLKVAVNLTPFDIYNPKAKSSTKLAAYDDLAACAVCCTARANFEINKNNTKFKSITLNSVQSINELPEQGRYQHCFNELYMDYLKKGQNKLNQDQVDDFVKQFNQKCVSQ